MPPQGSQAGAPGISGPPPQWLGWGSLQEGRRGAGAHASFGSRPAAGIKLASVQQRMGEVKGAFCGAGNGGQIQLTAFVL